MSTTTDTGPQQRSTGDPARYTDPTGVELGASAAPARPRRWRSPLTGAGLGVAAVVAGALVVSVVDDSTEPAIDISAHDPVDLNRATTLRDIDNRPNASTGLEDLNRAAALSDINTRPVIATGQADLNRAAALSDINAWPQATGREAGPTLAQRSGLASDVTLVQRIVEEAIDSALAESAAAGRSRLAPRDT